MAFSTKRGGRIESDEGFSVELGRDWLVYREGKRSMHITIDFGANEVVVSQVSIARWDDDMNHTVSETEQNRISGNIKRAVESQGHATTLM